MKKSIKSFLLSSLLLLTIFFPCKDVTAQENIKLWVNGNYIESDVSPIIENDRTLVPIRIISEVLGKQVEWNLLTKLV